MINLKHRPQVNLPDFSRADGDGTKSVFQQLMRFLFDQAKNVYDDIVAVRIGTGETLPTASEDWRGRFYLLMTDGAADELHFCTFDGAVYIWTQLI